ncbi:MAG: hypothetical protein Q7S79_04160 [bacterium]|nr:hypothetical protein [bacterium]
MRAEYQYSDKAEQKLLDQAGVTQAQLEAEDDKLNLNLNGFDSVIQTQHPLVWEAILREERQLAEAEVAYFESKGKNRLTRVQNSMNMGIRFIVDSNINASSSLLPAGVCAERKPHRIFLAAGFLHVKVAGLSLMDVYKGDDLNDTDVFRFFATACLAFWNNSLKDFSSENHWHPADKFPVVTAANLLNMTSCLESLFVVEEEELLAEKRKLPPKIANAPDIALKLQRKLKKAVSRVHDSFFSEADVGFDERQVVLEVFNRYPENGRELIYYLCGASIVKMQRFLWRVDKLSKTDNTGFYTDFYQRLHEASLKAIEKYSSPENYVSFLKDDVILPNLVAVGSEEETTNSRILRLAFELGVDKGKRDFFLNPKWFEELGMPKPIVADLRVEFDGDEFVIGFYATFNLEGKNIEIELGVSDKGYWWSFLDDPEEKQSVPKRESSLKMVFELLKKVRDREETSRVIYTGNTKGALPLRSIARKAQNLNTVEVGQPKEEPPTAVTMEFTPEGPAKKLLAGLSEQNKKRIRDEIDKINRTGKAKLEAKSAAHVDGRPLYSRRIGGVGAELRIIVAVLRTKKGLRGFEIIAAGTREGVWDNDKIVGRD